MKTNQNKRRKSLGIVQFNIEVSNSLHRGLRLMSLIEGKPLRKLAGEVLEDFYNSRKKDMKLPFNVALGQSQEHAIAA